MKKINNIKSNLFYLKQYGFNENLLSKIYKMNLEPLNTIFNNDMSENKNLNKYVTETDIQLSFNIQNFLKFKKNLFITNEFLNKKENNKIYFMLESNALNKITNYEIFPLFMYCKGNLELLDNKRQRIAIIGTRTPTDFYKKKAEKITLDYVKNDYIVVSGLAKGIDSIAHKTALKYNKDTIAVLPSNFNNIYPKINKDLAMKIEEKGLLLTSFGPNEKIKKNNFHLRNKFLVSISDTVVIIETNLNSGTMSAVKYAKELEKKILFLDQKNKYINTKLYNYGGIMIES